MICESKFYALSSSLRQIEYICERVCSLRDFRLNFQHKLSMLSRLDAFRNRQLNLSPLPNNYTRVFPLIQRSISATCTFTTNFTLAAGFEI